MRVGSIAVTDRERQDRLQLAHDFGFDPGMLRWALGVVERVKGNDARLTEWLSNSRHLDLPATEQFIRRARRLIDQEGGQA